MDGLGGYWFQKPKPGECTSIIETIGPLYSVETARTSCVAVSLRQRVDVSLDGKTVFIPTVSRVSEAARCMPL